MPLKISQLMFTAKAIGQMAPAFIKSGIVGTEGGPKALVATPGILARYRFTTARELEQGSITCPQRIALKDDDGELTYRELRNQARTFAKYLLKRKQARKLDEIRLGVMARNGRGILTPMGAKGYSGASIYLLNVGSSAEQLAGCLEENDINILVIDDEFVDRLPADLDGVDVVVGHTDKEDPQSHDFQTLESIVYVPEDYADVDLPKFPKHGYIVLMSSGTTGIPKGIMRPEPTVPVVVASIVGAMPWKANQTIQMTASMFHTWGWAAVNIALAARNTIITRRKFDPEACLDDIQRYQCEGLISSPIFFKEMVALDPDGDNPRYDTSSLKFIASAGNALTPQIVEETIARFGPILCNVYGSTELALASVAGMDAVAEDPTVGGQIAKGTTLRILDEEGNEVPKGTVGEIYLTNSTALIGYTNPKIKVNKVDGLISIGDLGYIDEHDNVHVVGRADDMIIVGGENVHPQSVTEVLETMPGIDEVHSGGAQDDNTFERIVVWAVRSKDKLGEAVHADAIREYVRTQLAEHSVPRDVHFLDKLPRNATGKVVPRLLDPKPEPKRKL